MIVRYCILGAIGFLVGCAQGPSEVLLDSFEGPLNDTTVDFGASENSSLAISASTQKKACGEQALKIEYNLQPSGYMWIARGYNLDVLGAGAWEIEPQHVDWQGLDAVSLSMYGSGSGSVIAFDIKDSGGEMWRILLDDDFVGWKVVACPLENFFPRTDWQPENAIRNEVIDFPIMAFQFEPRLPGTGTLYFDCIQGRRLKSTPWFLAELKKIIYRVFPKKSS